MHGYGRAGRPGARRSGCRRRRFTFSDDGAGRSVLINEIMYSLPRDNILDAENIGEEFIELIGYFLWLVGTIEYTYEARAIAFKQPRPLAQRLREQRRRLGSGKR